jgi:mRNA interferase MazF
MKKGDIVLASFPFTDLSGKKNRPTVILIAKELDVTVAFITTKLNWQEEYDVVLKPNTDNGLKKTSLIRLNKIAKLDKELIFGRLGTLTYSEINHLNKNLIKILQLDSL